MSARYIFRRFVGCLACISTLALGLVLPTPATAEDVKIGILFDVTGPETDSVPPALNAVKLAVDEINANGGILKSQKLQTIVGDSQGTAQGSIDAATRLVRVDNAAAIFEGIMSDPTMAAANGDSIPNGVLLVSPPSTVALITTLEDTIERTAIDKIDSEGR